VDVAWNRYLPDRLKDRATSKRGKRVWR